jgi:predicted DNA binding CopG/RHH family protein
MSKDYPTELESSISVRLKNSMLNEVARRAVKEGLSLEEWILKAVKGNLKKDNK